MRTHIIYSLMLVLPLALYTGCTDDDDDNGNENGGRGGTSASHAGSGGRAGHAGSGGRVVAEAGDTGNGEGGTAGESGGLAGATGESGSAGEAGAAGATAAFTNAQVIKIVATANEGEIAAAQVAKPSAQAAAVMTFAQTMITDHSAANMQVLGLVSTKHIAPAKSDVSEMLDDEAATLLATLSETPAAMFDRVYMASQVKMHQDVLTLLDEQLLPSASDADLKALLTAMRASVATHLANAKTIVAMLP